MEKKWGGKRPYFLKKYKILLAYWGKLEYSYDRGKCFQYGEGNAFSEERFYFRL